MKVFKATEKNAGRSMGYYRAEDAELVLDKVRNLIEVKELTDSEVADAVREGYGISYVERRVKFADGAPPENMEYSEEQVLREFKSG